MSRIYLTDIETKSRIHQTYLKQNEGYRPAFKDTRIYIINISGDAPKNIY